MLFGAQATGSQVDEFSIHHIENYEKSLFEYFERENPDVLKEIAEKKEISPELDEKIAKIMNAFNQEFKREHE